MSCADVTVVVATYNRPDVLGVVLRAALAHRPRVARVLVVGDACDERTALACKSLGDPRLRYVNLPTRFGEQSGPNSVGMHLADTEYVAFLNQDDVWLDGHIEDALDVLGRGGADLFFGRAAFATDVHADEAGRTVPRFEFVHPRRRDWPHAFRSPWFVEPASAWVFRRDLLKRVGPWRPARTLWRSPIQDWALRAWRAGAVATFGTRVTVLKVTTHCRRASQGPSYDLPSPEHAGLVDWMAAVGAEEVRSSLDRLPLRRTLGRATVERAVARVQAGEGLAVARGVARLCLRAAAANRVSARVFAATGLDVYSVGQKLLRRPPGAGLARAAVRRTGARLPDAPELDDVLRRVAAD